LKKNNTQNLQQTVRFFETLLRASADGIVITDPAKNIIFVNDTFCKFFSSNRQNMIETNLFLWLEKLDPSARDIWKGLENHINEHGIAKDVKFASKTGEGMRYFSVNSSLLEKIDIEEAGLIISIWRDDTERKMAQEALLRAHDELEVRVKERTAQLQESEGKYRRLFEYSNDIIVQVDKFGKIVAVNNKIKETLGFTPEEVIGRYFFNIGILGIGELHGIVKQFKKAVVEGKIKDNTGRFFNKLELKLKAKNGNLVFIETGTTILKKDGKIEGFLTNIRDISERKQAEDILHIQKDIALSLSVSGDTNIILDRILQAISRIEGLDSGGIYISDRLTGDLILRAHYGFSSGFVQKVAHYAPDTPQWRLVQAGQPVYFTNSNDSLEIRPQARKPEGLLGVAIIPVVQQGRVIGSLNTGSHTLDEIPVHARMILETIAGHLREVIVSIKSEEELKDAKNYLDTIIKSSYDGIFVVDEEGRFEFGNEAFFNIIGYPESEIMGHSFMKVIHQDYHDFILKRWKEVQGGKGKPYEVDIIQKDGTVRSLSVSHTDMEFGGNIKYCVIAKDITQRKLAEEERNQLLEREHEAHTEAEAAKKLDRMKSMFLASTSHELRTPLNSVIGFSSMLLEGYSGNLNPEQKEQLEIVHSSGKHLLTLINDIIDISKIEAGNINLNVSEFKLGPLVNDVASMLNVSLSEKKLDLKVNVQDIVMRSDRTRLLQCIMNLISNAIKYTENGSVEITTKVINNNVIITVTDTGIGIKPEDIPKIFSPFVRLQTPLTYKTSGTGLGLYMVKKITKDFLGGDVEVKSEIGKGSTFKLRVPVEIEA